MKTTDRVFLRRKREEARSQQVDPGTDHEARVGRTGAPPFGRTGPPQWRGEFLQRFLIENSVELRQIGHPSAGIPPAGRGEFLNNF